MTTMPRSRRTGRIRLHERDTDDTTPVYLEDHPYSVRDTEETANDLDEEEEADLAR